MDWDVLGKLIDEMLDLPRTDLRDVRLLVVGCSSSEIAGGNIGKASVPDYGDKVAEIVLAKAKARGFDVAFQCCEHLNRALVVEDAAAEKYGLERVCVVPQIHAGGSCATAAYRRMEKPVVVESVRADAGIDIGGTLIGMHLKPVAIPLRLSGNRLGEASVAFARTRAKLIGGPRAVYTDETIH